MRDYLSEASTYFLQEKENEEMTVTKQLFLWTCRLKKKKNKFIDMLRYVYSQNNHTFMFLALFSNKVL